MLRGMILALGVVLLPLQARACDVALVLAVDVSGSVDPEDYDIQMQGLAVGLADPSVADALVRARAQVMVLQWTGVSRQHVSIPWFGIESHADVAKLAAQVAQVPRAWRSFSTAIGEALGVAFAAFDAPEVAHCDRRVIDVSGDGRSNEGPPPETMRAEARARGITVNALAIEETEAGLVAYFRQNVIVGPRSFAVRAASFDDYPDRIRAKLLRELTRQVALAE